jgi:hypothetical protein
MKARPQAASLNFCSLSAEDVYESRYLGSFTEKTLVVSFIQKIFNHEVVASSSPGLRGFARLCELPWVRGDYACQPDD